MPIADAFIQELEQEAQATRRVLERVPANKLGWKPHPKSMSLGQIAMHVAQTPGMVAQMTAEDMREPPRMEQAEAKSAKELLDAHDTSIAAAKQILKSWDDAKMKAPWSMFAGGKPIMTMPRAAVVRTILLNHWYHHRGQLTVYLRLLDQPLPVVYGPTADENPFR